MSLATFETLATGSFRPPEVRGRSVVNDVMSSWFAALTRARHEKRVEERLSCKGVKAYVPLYEKTSRWKDRRVRLRLPLFAGYVFVSLPWRDRLRALEVPGVVRFVSFGGNPAAVPDEEIESIRVSLQSGLGVKPTQGLCLGQRVRIHSGPLEGCEGYLVRRKGAYRLILSVSLIQRSIAVEIDARDVLLATSATL